MSLLSLQLKTETVEEQYNHLEGNRYKPQLALLVMTRLREIHAQIMLGDDKTSLQSAVPILQYCISLAQYMAQSDESTVSELLVQLAMIKRAQGNSHEATRSLLLEALSSALNYNLVHSLYCMLSEELSTQSHQTLPQDITKSVPPSRSSETKRLSRQGSRSSSRVSAYGTLGVSREEKEWFKERKTEGYQAWCAMRTAAYTLQPVEKLHQLSSELHNVEMTTPLSDKLLSKLPDIVVLDLYGSTENLSSMLYTLDTPTVDSLLPLSQSTTPKGITWFQLLGYYKGLLKQCFLSSNSMWRLHVHCLTPCLLPRVQVLRSFLQTHCPNFNKFCNLPNVPPVFLSSENSDSDTSSTDAPAYLTATDGEVAILWYTPYDKSPDIVNGLVGLNTKPIKTLLYNNLHTMGIEVHIIKNVYRSQLVELCSVWEKLATACNEYLTQQAARPLSRSPSRMRQRSIEQSKLATPIELKVNVAKMSNKLKVNTIVYKVIQLVYCEQRKCKQHV